MKKLFLILVFCSFSAALFAQIPKEVQEKFKEKYPNATAVAWTPLGQDEYQVAFIDKDNIQNYIVYNEDGKLMRSEVETREYPADIKTYYVKNYPDEKEYHVWVATDENGNATYYVREHEYRLYFDKTGHFLRKEADKAKEKVKEMKNDDDDDDDDD